MQPVLVTASHCTLNRNQVDGESIRSPLYTGVVYDQKFERFGQEIFDAPSYRCGPLFRVRDCRHADVAAYNLSNMYLEPGETAFQSGKIANPYLLLWVL